MGTTTADIFGDATPQPATPGSYGLAPSGYRLPQDTRLGTARLQVADLGRSIRFYVDLLGFRVADRTDARASLAPQGDDRVVLELHERGGARPSSRSKLGLYHVAILLPDRPSLGRFVRHLADAGVQAGAGDHLVSEALYLTDPDGLGIEVYADRPRETWHRLGRELMLATDPVDIAARHSIMQRLKGAFVAGFEKVERAFEAGIDHAPPRIHCALLYLKGQLLPIGVDHHVEVDVLVRSAVQGKGEAAGIVCKVGLTPHPIPTHILAPEPAPRQ